MKINWDQIKQQKSWNRLTLKEKLHYFVISGVWIENMNFTGSEAATLIEIIARRGSQNDLKKVAQILKRV